MLTIFQRKSKLKKEKYLESEGDYKGNIRHFPSSNKEWKNSIYAYNKNTLKLLPIADNVVLELIKGYFNMYSLFLRKKNKIRFLSAWKRRIQSRKFWIGKPELKHTNDKVIIDLYIYNRPKKFFIHKILNLTKSIKIKMLKSLKERAFVPLPMRKYSSLKKIKNFSIPRVMYKSENTNTLNNIPKQVSRTKYKTYIEKINKLKHTSLKIKLWLKSKIIIYNIIYKDIYLGIDKTKFSISKYLNNFYYNILKKNSFLRKKILKKELFLMHYMQSYFLNQFKFSSTYIEPLVLVLNKIYKKKVIFNLVKLKTYYLDSEILTQILLAKTIKRNNSINRILRTSLFSIKVPNLNIKLINRYTTKLIKQQNILVQNSEKKSERLLNKDIMDTLLYKNYRVSDTIATLNNINNKTVSGVRLEASGRLTKRITAARSLFKIKYIGTLKDIDSSYRGMSSVMLKGNIKSNTQFSKQNSKRHIGSFGLKGWISSI